MNREDLKALFVVIFVVAIVIGSMLFVYKMAENEATKEYNQKVIAYSSFIIGSNNYDCADIVNIKVNDRRYNGDDITFTFKDGFVIQANSDNIIWVKD